MKYILRDYQRKAVEKMQKDSDNFHKSIVALPTGAGKSLVIASFVAKATGSALIIQPSREILSQNKEKLLTYVDKKTVGVYSASFNLKEIKQYTFATIQSIYKKPELFKHFDWIIIDEAHLYKVGGMFDTFLKNIGKKKVYGLTATPFKLVQEKRYNWSKREMHVYGVLRMLTQIGFSKIIYTISTRKLVRHKYLVPLEYKVGGDIKADFKMNSDKKIVESFDTMLSLSGMDKVIPALNVIKNYKSTIIFCPSVAIAQRMQKAVEGFPTAFVSGDTPAKERKQILADFISGKIRAVFNCEVLTTGFDHPALDCIVLARPTKSLNLYNQMLGRGTRTAEGKTKCTIFDITGTTNFLGKLEDIEVKKIDGKWDVQTIKGKTRDKIMSYYKRSLR